jgi:hypothetical protein
MLSRPLILMTQSVRSIARETKLVIFITQSIQSAALVPKLVGRTDFGQPPGRATEWTARLHLMDLEIVVATRSIDIQRAAGRLHAIFDKTADLA